MSGGDAPHFVYTLRDADENVLYVGCTWNIASRLAQHTYSKGWWADVVYIDVQRFPDQAIALDNERGLIRQYSPRHNVRHTAREAKPMFRRGRAAVPS